MSDKNSLHQYTPEERHALQEAQHVLESLEGGSDTLDGFNLLGVVANPRGPHHERSASRSGSSIHGRSQHGRSQHGASQASASASADASSAFYFADSTMQALEHTLSSMTEQIDVLNDTLEYWSRHYLGSYDEAADILEYTPPELAENLTTEIPESDLTALQQYLQESGVMAQKLSASLQQQQQQQASMAAFEQGEVEETIDPLFFQPYFDLTDPSTFCQLLVREDNDDENDENGTSAAEEQVTASLSSADIGNAALSIPTSQILRLPPPDYFTQSLDRVEVSLLNQVRIKSAQFFHETNRFGLLQEWIAGLVQECKRVRVILDSLTRNSVHAWELIPQLDTKRQHVAQIAHVLDQAQDVIRCKSSIGGLLSAGQDLSAGRTNSIWTTIVVQSRYSWIAGTVDGRTTIESIRSTCGGQFGQ